MRVLSSRSLPRSLLDVLLRTRLVVTDIVKQETFDRGALPGASIEARRLFMFYEAHAEAIDVRSTTLGRLLELARRTDLEAPSRHLGELSIQSLLIDLRASDPATKAVVLFEDAWFIRQAMILPPNCTLVSTNALLRNLERAGLIPSAAEAEARIRRLRPTYNAAVERLKRADTPTRPRRHRS